MSVSPFHLAIPVRDLEEARRFYTTVFDCPIGRESPGEWIDLDFYGHQLSLHLAPAEPAAKTNPVDSDPVPVRHFGVVLPWERWHALAAAFQEQKVPFLIPPKIRFRGRVGEQATMFLLDPSGNAIELKSFQNPEDLFRTKLDTGTP